MRARSAPIIPRYKEVEASVIARVAGYYSGIYRLIGRCYRGATRPNNTLLSSGWKVLLSPRSGLDSTCYRYDRKEY